MEPQSIGSIVEHQREIQRERIRGFGQYLKVLRTSKHNAHDESLSQQELGALSGLGKDKIADIEQGKVVNLFPYLQALVDGLSLTHAEVPGFYERAGCVPPNPPRPYDDQHLCDILTQIDYPAAARTPLWDFIGFNEQHRTLWGTTASDIETMRDGSILGANLLRVVFKFQLKRDPWQKQELPRIVWSFRSASSAYVDQPRYQALKEEMWKDRNFRQAWTAANFVFEDQSEGNRTRPFTSIPHAELGVIRFISLRIPVHYIGGTVDLAVYMPTRSSLKPYMELMKDKPTHVYMFV